VSLPAFCRGDVVAPTDSVATNALQLHRPEGAQFVALSGLKSRFRSCLTLRKLASFTTAGHLYRRRGRQRCRRTHQCTPRSETPRGQGQHGVRAAHSGRLPRFDFGRNDGARCFVLSGRHESLIVDRTRPIIPYRLGFEGRPSVATSDRGSDQRGLARHRRAGGCIRESRALKVRRRATFESSLSGYFDDVTVGRSRDSRGRRSSARSVPTLNPVDPALLARSANRLREIHSGDPTTKTARSLRRRPACESTGPGASLWYLFDGGGARGGDHPHRGIGDALSCTRGQQCASSIRGTVAQLIGAIDHSADDGGLVKRVLAARLSF